MAAEASFAIEIAATMGGGEQTIAELDTLSSELMGAGKNAALFQEAIVQVSGDLARAREESAAAAEALAQGSAEFAGLERSAIQAAKAVERLAAKGDTNSDAYREAANAAKLADSSVGAYAKTLRELEHNADAAAGKEKKLAETLTNVRKISSHVNQSAANQTEKFDGLADGFQLVGGRAGQMGDSIFTAAKKFSKLSSEMGSSNATALLAVAGMAAVVLALVAVAVAAVAATVKIAAWAIGLADTRRQAELSAEAFAAMNPELAGLPFDTLARDTGLAAGALRGMSRDLKAAGVASEDMNDALRAAASAEVFKEATGGAAEFVSQIKEGKRSTRELANEMNAKLGGSVAKNMLGLEAQSKRLEHNVSDIFGGLDIDPALEGMQTLVGLLDETSAAGQTIKEIFEDIFQPLIDSLDEAALVIEAFALGFLIGLTKVEIAIKPAIRVIADLFGFEDTSLEEILNGATKAGEYVAYAFVAVAAVLGPVIALIGAATAVVVLFVGALAAIPAAIAAMVGGLIYAVVGIGGRVIDFFKTFSLAEIGTDLIRGLAAGITGAAGLVVSAITGVARGAINAAKSLLGISSPSTVFAGIGEDTGAGMTMGVEESTGDVESAVNAMVAPPASPFAAAASPDAIGGGGALPPNVAAAGAGAAAGGGASITITGPISFHGLPDAPTGIEQLAEMLTRALEGSALSIGAGAEGV